MSKTYRPHLLGIDDGPFVKVPGATTPIVAVMMEGADLIESVALSSFTIDGDGVSEFLARWIAGLRSAEAVQAVLLGGITIAGLAIIDVSALSRELAKPVLVVNRKEPTNHRLAEALAAAGLNDRATIIERCPEAFRMPCGLFVACAGVEDVEAARLVEAAQAKSLLPEPLRVAHLIARAVARGESRGRP
ncbi:MAG: DUF99 family protein [Deltaproteobacteria bacterium]|nr:DUF99 family protein [Deltaproteobacteria bacterium]